MKFRHEWKHEVNPADLMLLRMRLDAVMERDKNCIGGRYEIRSLYFDTPDDRVLRDKLDGLKYREKYRIRLYNGNMNLIKLEKKTKVNDLSNKVSAKLTGAEAQSIVDGVVDWMPYHESELVRELYANMQTKGLQPKTIVDYTREPFVYGPGNVRVTLDYNLRTGLGCTDFLNPDCITIPAGNAPAVLEVKWDEYLPDIIRDAVQLQGRRRSAFSKYAQCRIYG